MNMMVRYGHYGDARAHRKFGQAPLTEDELRRAAPSVFALDKHESRSDKYAYIPTWDVVQALEKQGFDPYTVKQGKSRVPGKEDFTKHMIRFRHRSLVDVKSGDSVLEIALRNAHDGTAAYEIMGALWRVSCLNALVSGGQMLIHRKVPHKGNVIDQVIDATYTVLEESKVLTHVPQEWGGITLNAGERAAFAEAVHTLRFEDNAEATQQAIKPADLLAPRRAGYQGNDLWRTFNVAQENAIKGGLTGMGRDANDRPRRITTRPVQNIDQDVKLNRALWVLAEKMAELKAA